MKRTPLDEYSERYMCERCNEYVHAVTATPIREDRGYWNLCEDCVTDLVHEDELQSLGEAGDS